MELFSCASAIRSQISIGSDLVHTYGMFVFVNAHISPLKSTSFSNILTISV